MRKLRASSIGKAIVAICLVAFLAVVSYHDLNVGLMEGSASAQVLPDESDFGSESKKPRLKISTSSAANPLGSITINGTFDTSQPISVLFKVKGKSVMTTVDSATASSIQITAPPLEGTLRLRVVDGHEVSNFVKIKILPLPTSTQPVGTVALDALQALQNDPNTPADSQADLAAIISRIEDVLSGTKVPLGTLNGKPIFVTTDAVGYFDRLLLAERQTEAGDVVLQTENLNSDMLAPSLGDQASTILEMQSNVLKLVAVKNALLLLALGGTAATAVELFGLISAAMGLSIAIAGLGLALGLYLSGQGPDAIRTVCIIALQGAANALDAVAHVLGAPFWLKAFIGFFGEIMIKAQINADQSMSATYSKWCLCPTSGSPTSGIDAACEPTPTATATATATYTATATATATVTATVTATETATATVTATPTATVTATTTLTATPTATATATSTDTDTPTVTATTTDTPTATPTATATDLPTPTPTATIDPVGLWQLSGSGTDGCSSAVALSGTLQIDTSGQGTATIEIIDVPPPDNVCPNLSGTYVCPSPFGGMCGPAPRSDGQPGFTLDTSSQSLSSQFGVNTQAVIFGVFDGTGSFSVEIGSQGWVSGTVESSQ